MENPEQVNPKDQHPELKYPTRRKLEDLCPSTTINPVDFDLLTSDFNAMFQDEKQGFGPGTEELALGDGVPSSLDQLVDWLDIAWGETDDTSLSHDIQHFDTFSTDDKWPI